MFCFRLAGRPRAHPPGDPPLDPSSTPFITACFTGITACFTGAKRVVTPTQEFGKILSSPPAAHTAYRT
eukprot:3310189-Pyramimonas_sp.AAC.1